MFGEPDRLNTARVAAPLTVFISSALNYDVLAKGRVTTSSQKFEKELVLSYADIADTCVINISRLQGEESQFIGKIEFLLANYLTLASRLLQLGNGRRLLIVSTGYDPRLMLILTLFRLLGAKSFTFIYDTHQIAIRRHNFVRRFTIDVYFTIGFTIAGWLNGWIVLNDRFVRKRNRRINFIKTWVGMQSRDYDRSASPRQDGQFVFLYSGTLIEDNGTRLLVEAMKSVPNRNVKLEILGDGPLAGFVRRSAEVDPRIFYYGRVDNFVAIKRQDQANFLVHLRDPRSPAGDYSFPSKLAEYLSGPTPVMSNRFPGCEGYMDFVDEIGEYTAESISDSIIKVLENRITKDPRTDERRRFVASRGWDGAAKAIRDFVIQRDKPPKRQCEEDS